MPNPQLPMTAVVTPSAGDGDKVRSWLVGAAHCGNTSIAHRDVTDKGFVAAAVENQRIAD